MTSFGTVLLNNSKISQKIRSEAVSIDIRGAKGLFRICYVMYVNSNLYYYIIIQVLML